MNKLTILIILTGIYFTSCCRQFAENDEHVIDGKCYFDTILSDTNVKYSFYPRLIRTYNIDLCGFNYFGSGRTKNYFCDIIIINFKKNVIDTSHTEYVNSVETPMNKCGFNSSYALTNTSFEFYGLNESKAKLKCYKIMNKNSMELNFGENNSKIQYYLGTDIENAITYFIVEKNKKRFIVFFINNKKYSLLNEFNQVLKNSKCNIIHTEVFQ